MIRSLSVYTVQVKIKLLLLNLLSTQGSTAALLAAISLNIFQSKVNVILIKSKFTFSFLLVQNSKQDHLLKIPQQKVINIKRIDFGTLRLHLAWEIS